MRRYSVDNKVKFDQFVGLCVKLRMVTSKYGQRYCSNVETSCLVCCYLFVIDRAFCCIFAFSCLCRALYTAVPKVSEQRYN